jgi:hypothetical protein
MDDAKCSELTPMSITGHFLLEMQLYSCVYRVASRSRLNYRHDTSVSNSFVRRNPNAGKNESVVTISGRSGDEILSRVDE